VQQELITEEKMQIVASVGDPSRAEDKCLYFVFGEHKGWQQEAGAKDIAEAWFALDIGSLRPQGGDVP
jgi:hypothetical protein